MSDVTLIERAVALLKAGSLVGLPTETVYGLAADAHNPVAVAKIFSAKGRPADHPLIVHLGADDLLPNYARDIPESAWLLAEAFWPGPLTLILKKQAQVPSVVTGGQDTVGVRVPGHPVALDLLRAFAAENPTQGGLAAPSANQFGRISPTTAAHVANELGEAVSLILDGGACQVGIESTIVDLSIDTPRILRPGAITAEQLSLVLGQRVQAPDASANATVPRVSGSLVSHYAPRTPLSVASLDAIATQVSRGGVAAIVRDTPELSFSLRQRPEVVVLADAPSAYAHDFYRILRELDTGDYTQIYVQALPTSADWLAIQDRLGRAAHAVD